MRFAPPRDAFGNSSQRGPCARQFLRTVSVMPDVSLPKRRVVPFEHRFPHDRR